MKIPRKVYPPIPYLEGVIVKAVFDPATDGKFEPLVVLEGGDVVVQQSRLSRVRELADAVRVLGPDALDDMATRMTRLLDGQDEFGGRA